MTQVLGAHKCHNHTRFFTFSSSDVTQLIPHLCKNGYVMHIHLACSFDCFLEYPSKAMMICEIRTSIVSYLCIEQHEWFIEEVLEENDEINHYWAFHNIALDFYPNNICCTCGLSLL